MTPHGEQGRSHPKPARHGAGQSQAWMNGERGKGDIMKDGGLAFPVAEGPETIIHDWGMSLRDYFAAKAMQGLATSRDHSIEGIAVAAYALADAMLKARG
jgi:hypothetical protein